MDKRAGPLAEISLETGEISPTGMKIFPYKHSQAGWPACRDNFWRKCACVCSFTCQTMAELSEVREVSTAAKKADKTEKKVQRKNFRWEAVMIEHLNISVQVFCTFDANNFAFVTKSCKPSLLAASNVFSTLK